MQTKLSVALAATLAGFALSAQAANVEVYGLIDTGLNYQHVDSRNRRNRPGPQGGFRA